MIDHLTCPLADYSNIKEINFMVISKPRIFIDFGNIELDLTAAGGNI